MERMYLGSDYNHRLQRMDALEKKVKEQEQTIETLQRTLAGWRLIARHSRNIIDQLKAERHEREAT